MARVKNSVQTRKKRKKVLKETKGYFGSKHRLYRTANEQLMNSGNYAFRDRKARKRDFRKLWITRINAAVREEGMTYSTFMNGLRKADIELNRKVLSELAINNENAFKEIVELSKKALGKKTSEPKKEVKIEEKPKAEIKENKEVDLTEKTVAELKDLAKEKGLSGYSTLKKDELIDLIKNNK